MPGPLHFAANLRGEAAHQANGYNADPTHVAYWDVRMLSAIRVSERSDGIGLSRFFF